MKQGKMIANLVMILLTVGLLCYFGAHIYSTFHTSYTTTQVYNLTVVDSVEAEGLIIRDEVVLASQSGIVDPQRDEGERVGVGQTVALVYSDTAAMERQSELDEVEQEITLLRTAMEQREDVLSVANLDEEILAAIVALQGTVGSGDYRSLDDQAAELKAGVLSWAYTFDSSYSASDLESRLTTLYSQYNTLSSATATTTSTVRSWIAGAYSCLTDGYETVISPSNMGDLTVESLTSLLENQPETTDNPAGKIILGTDWYLAVSVPEEATATLEVGDSLTVAFTGEFYQQVSMTVHQIGASEEGMVVMILSSDRYLADTTLLRRQTVELIYQSQSGLRVPKEALRTFTSTVEDKETGEILSTTIETGVYAIVSGVAEFKAVTILTEGTDFAIVSPVTTGSRALQAGDEIVVHGTELYDGKAMTR